MNAAPPFQVLPQGYFGLLAADPPWKFRVRSKKGEGRSPERHYRTMTLGELMALSIGVRQLTTENAWLALWVPGPHLAQAFTLIPAWGFKYSGIGWAWAKTKKRALIFDRNAFHVGMGYTTRHNIELCLLARRGSPKRLRKDVRELIISPLREHSRKPDEFYDRARAFAPGPYLELFAREIRPGWEAWGDEVGRFNGDQER